MTGLFVFDLSGSDGLITGISALPVSDDAAGAADAKMTDSVQKRHQRVIKVDRVGVHTVARQRHQANPALEHVQRRRAESKNTTASPVFLINTKTVVQLLIIIIRTICSYCDISITRNSIPKI